MDIESLRRKLSYQGILLGGTVLVTSAALALASAIPVGIFLVKATLDSQQG